MPSTKATSTRKPCLLDSDVLIDHLRGHAAARTLMAALPLDCAVSAMTVAELHAGVRDGAELDALTSLLESFVIVDISPPIAAEGGLLRRNWGKTNGLGLSDALIAATAIATGRVLVTLNAKHFPMLGRGKIVVPYRKR